MKRSNLENIFLMELKKAGGRLEDSSVADKIFSYLKTVDINAYIHYLEEEYDWISYFRHKRFTCQKYGYFVWGRDWKQILFQFIRPCRFLTIRLYKVTLSQPKSFFNHHYEWEKQNLLENMIPRCREVLEHLDEYKTIYGQLSDDESKRCFLYVIMGYLTLKYDYFHKAKHSGERIDYYPEDIFHRLPQVIVDCGSYIGDTALQYLKHFGDRISSIYLFEPDEKNMKKAQEDLAFWSIKIMFVQAAVSDDDGIIRFSANGAGGRIVRDGNEEIKMVALDNKVKEKISFLKMDIEGAELMALHGAKQHIISDLPDLAICAYHKPTDIRELILYVKSLNPLYKVYLRHYSDKHKETVLYFSVK